MHDEDNQFELGKLSAEVRNLIVGIAAIKTDMTETRKAIEDLKIWKGQVMAVSWVSSFVASGVFWGFGLVVKHLWP